MVNKRKQIGESPQVTGCHTNLLFVQLWSISDLVTTLSVVEPFQAGQ